MYKVLIIALLLILKQGVCDAQNDWVLSNDKDGIKIYTSTVPDSKIKAIKVLCDFKATPSQFVALMLDVKACPEWVYHTKSCSLVKQVSNSELYYYSEINLPWPAKNRDFVAHLTVTQNPETKIVSIDGPSVSGFVPVKESVVRIDHSKGKWTITPLNNEQIRVEYTLHVDPGGSLPAWLVNMFATEGPQQIFKNLKMELQKPQYKSASLPFIENYGVADNAKAGSKVQYEAAK